MRACVYSGMAAWSLWLLTQVHKLEEGIRFMEQRIHEYKGCSDVAEIYEAKLKPLREQLDQHQHQHQVGVATIQIVGQPRKRRASFSGT